MPHEETALFGVSVVESRGDSTWRFDYYDEYLLLGVRNKETRQYCDKSGYENRPGNRCDLAFYTTLPQAKALLTRAAKKYVQQVKSYNYAHKDDPKPVPTEADARTHFEIVRVPLPT